MLHANEHELFLAGTDAFLKGDRFLDSNGQGWVQWQNFLFIIRGERVPCSGIGGSWREGLNEESSMEWPVFWGERGRGGDRQ
jgi:hypothetical protein